MNGKKIIIFFFFLVLSPGLFSQLSYVDSLKYELKTSQNDTLNIALYSLLCSSYQSSSYDSTLFYAEKQFQLAHRLNYKLDEAYALDNIGYNMYYLSNPQALQTLFEGVKIAEDPGIENKILPEKYWSMSVYYDKQALPKHKRNPSNVRLQILASLNQDIGHVYGNDFGNRRKQLFYYYKAASIAEDADDKYSVILNYNTIASTYLIINELDSGLLYGQKAYNLAIAEDLQKLSVHTLSIMGNIYFEKKNYPLAINYSERAIEGGIKYKMMNNGVVQANLILSNIFLLKDQVDSSFYYAKRAYETARQINSPQFILSSTDALVRLYTSTRNLDSAFKYLQLSYALKDNVYSAEKIKQIQRLDFEEREKQKEIEASKQNYQSRLRMYVLLSGLIALLVIAGILVRSIRHKQKAFTLLQKQKLETDKQKTKAEETLTELRSTQAQLIQSEKMASLGELTAGIAHEIQNPLNFVNNFSEVNKELVDELQQELKEGKIDTAISISNDIKENEEKIYHHGQRADAIVKSMLQHSRSSSGQKELTDINVLADECLRLSFHGIRAKDRSFNSGTQTEFDKDIPLVHVVPQEIGRVILNLLTNAFYSVIQKKKQLGGEYEPMVVLKTSLQASPQDKTTRVIISVWDNGKGIPQNVIDKIFQPFFTTKPTGEGTGLGLSMSYDIVTKTHGGEFRVKSAEGEWAEFTIILPI